MTEGDTSAETAFDGAPGGPEEARRSGAEGLIIAAIGFVVGLVTSGIAASIWAGTHGIQVTDTTLGLQISELLGLWIGLLGVPLVASVVRNRGGPVPDLALRVRWIDAPIGIAAGLGTTFLVGVLYSPFLENNKDLRDRFSEPAKHITNTVHDTGGKVLLAVFLVLLVPIVEECYFRGVVFRSLDRLLPTAVAVVAGGAIFGLAHGELLQLPALAGFGIVLCVLAHRTGRLGPCLFAHAAFNAAAVVTLFTK